MKTKYWQRINGSVISKISASAVAVVREMNAEGSLIYTLLGVTVLSDVSVIALFTLTSLVSGSLLANRQKTSSVVWVFLAQMITALLLGGFLACSCHLCCHSRIFLQKD